MAGPVAAPVAVSDAYSTDGWQNQLTGMSVANRDKREADRICLQILGYQQLTAVYQASWLAARIVDKPVDEMTREGYDLHLRDDEDGAQEVVDYLESIDTECVLEQALRWQRLFGGALVLIGANDGQTDLSQPLDESKLQSIDYLNVFDPSEARPVTWQDNPAEKGFGEVLLWAIQPTVIGQEVPRNNEVIGAAQRMLIPALMHVHASRVFPFFGVQVNRQYGQYSANPGMNRGWGDSVLARCIKIVRDFEGSWDGAAFQLREFSQAIYKIQGLAQALLADKGMAGETFVARRMRSIEMSRSLLRAVMLDKDGEDFQRQDASMAGVADTLREFGALVSAVADIPSTVLMNTQGGGLGASGSGSNDITNWYATVKGKQKKEVKPFIAELCRLVCLAEDGPDVDVIEGRNGELKPDGLKVDFRSLYQLTLQEQADLMLKLAQSDNLYLNMGAISALDIGKARFSGKPIQVTMVADPGELEVRTERDDEMAATQHDVTVTNLQEHGSTSPPPPPAIATKDGSDDQPREDNGEWASGGGGGSGEGKSGGGSSGGGAKSALAADYHEANQQAKGMKKEMLSKSVHELQATREKEQADHNGVFDRSPRYLAASKELKRRGITSHAKLAAALASEKS